ncbi:hypothetical protein P3339_00995 [Microbulbifer sp. MLAF003]|uniref:hypothetical protein n=1 Tax=Microbulbifer sp. MLAF003 TaxID=3032582 RepID=UPI0024ACABE2|nr:hypothetical protein [Microbulbifer sp. MLAF003]WHI51445.1 hypothetical protein P3339_00995 [Microbulbifer sp. MLAF003]
MFTDLDQLVTSFLEILSGVSALTGFIFVTFFLLVCFLPSIVAFFLTESISQRSLQQMFPQYFHGLPGLHYSLGRLQVSGEVRIKASR